MSTTGNVPTWADQRHTGPSTETPRYEPPTAVEVGNAVDLIRGGGHDTTADKNGYYH
ncbi:MAG: hypothetical protein ACRDTA_26880 [Pseudonocardiaceae bacterium]